MSRQEENGAVEPEDQRVASVAQPRGIFCDYVQHRLDVGRRTRDNAQDFTCRRLLFQRFLEFLEQPDVLNSDHGLIGEGL